MRDIKRSRCAFVVIKLLLGGGDHLLMRKDQAWKDISFIGGHESRRDRGKLRTAARRELLEEVPALRSFERIELEELTEEITYGPVYSRSARHRVKYDLQFFLLRFGETPKHVIGSLGPRTPNVLISQEEVLVPRRYKIAELAKVLARQIPGGLRAIPYSWSEDLGSLPSYLGSSHDQLELPLERSEEGNAPGMADGPRNAPEMSRGSRLR